LEGLKPEMGFEETRSSIHRELPFSELPFNGLLEVEVVEASKKWSMKKYDKQDPKRDRQGMLVNGQADAAFSHGPGASGCGVGSLLRMSGYILGC
jgi:hypothetical protein